MVVVLDCHLSVKLKPKLNNNIWKVANRKEMVSIVTKFLKISHHILSICMEHKCNKRIEIPA